MSSDRHRGAVQSRPARRRRSPLRPAHVGGSAPPPPRSTTAIPPSTSRRPAPASRARPTASAPTRTPAEYSACASCISRVPSTRLELGDSRVHRDVGGAGADADGEQRQRERRHRIGEGRQRRRDREADDEPRQDPRSAAVELTTRQEHRRQRADGDEEERQSKRALRRADRGLHRGDERGPTAPEDSECDERGERPAPAHTRSQPVGNCGIGHAGSGRQSSQPVGNGHSSRTRCASARTSSASSSPSAAACSSSSSSFHR